MPTLLHLWGAHGSEADTRGQVTQSVKSEAVLTLVLTLNIVNKYTPSATNVTSCQGCELAPVPYPYNSSGHFLLKMKGPTQQDHFPSNILPTLTRDARCCPDAIPPIAVLPNPILALHLASSPPHSTHKS